jgi:hypothetical protein
MNIMQTPSLTAMNSGSSTNNNNTGFGGSQQDEAAKNKMKQQRILLLRHASKCPYGEMLEGGNGQPCPTTPNCSSMKKLWKHMTSCKEPLNKCSYAHCNSSKYVMNHYRRCNDSACPCCEPVREIIRKQQAKKQANMQQAQQQQQQQAQQQQQQHSLSQSGGMMQAPVAPTPPSFNFDIEIPDPTPLNDINNGNNIMGGGGNRLNGGGGSRSNSRSSSASGMGSQSQVSAALQRPPSLTLSSPGNVNVNMNMNNRPTIGYGNNQNPQQTQLQYQQYQQQQQQQRMKQQQALQQAQAQRPDSTSSPSHHHQPPLPVGSASAAAMADAKKRKFDSISSSIAIPPALPAELNALVAKYTIAQLGSYLANLKSKMPSTHDQGQLVSKCQPVLDAVTNGHMNSWVFMSPVDPVALQLPDYNNVVKHPMDLGTVGSKLQNRQFKSVEEFGADVRLTFDNAMLYNPDGSEVHNWAREMKDIFILEYGKMLTNL